MSQARNQAKKHLRKQDLSRYLNDATYVDFLERLKKIAISIFEWQNLPDSMDARRIELALFERGQCAFLKDEYYGLINTNATSGGKINIYGLPTMIQCYAYTYRTTRKMWTGMRVEPDTDEDLEDAILVMNNFERYPTVAGIQLYCMRLTDVQRAIDTNVKMQKYPYLLTTDTNQKLSMENLYNSIDGNKPAIFMDKNFDMDRIRSIPTEAPYVVDKLNDYKNDLFNEALTFLGINNLYRKKERMITDETDQNNELINLNLESFLITRQKACEQFNKRYGKNIQVKVRSDLHNIIKEVDNAFSDAREELIEQKAKEEVINE